jgi:hypothetical protein
MFIWRGRAVEGVVGVLRSLEVGVLILIGYIGGIFAWLLSQTQNLEKVSVRCRSALRPLRGSPPYIHV